MSIIKSTFDKMLRKIPDKKSNEEMYQDLNWTFSIIYYIEELMLRLELRDECVKRYVHVDLISKSEKMETASFKKKFQILVEELLNIKPGMTVEEYLKYYICTPKGSIKRCYLHRNNNKRVHTMSVSIRKVKHIPDGSICL